MKTFWDKKKNCFSLLFVVPQVQLVLLMVCAHIIYLYTIPKYEKMFETHRFTLGNCLPWPKEAADIGFS
jgi:hypothetical protein